MPKLPTRRSEPGKPKLDESTLNVSSPAPVVMVKSTSPLATSPLESMVIESSGLAPSLVAVSMVKSVMSKNVSDSKATPSLAPEMRFRPAAGLSMASTSSLFGVTKVKLARLAAVTGSRPEKLAV